MSTQKGTGEAMRTIVRWVLVTTILLGIGIGASFAAGTAYGRTTAIKTVQPIIVNSQNTSATTAGTTVGFGADSTPSGSQAASGFRPGGLSGAGFLSATIREVSDQQITVTLPNGQELTVNRTQDTRIGSVTPSQPAVLTAGAHVLIAGARGSDGGFAATAIIVVPADFLPTPMPNASSPASTGNGPRAHLTPTPTP